ncbi:MAG: hemolysin III family protein [Pseudomonadota bacterium]
MREAHRIERIADAAVHVAGIGLALVSLPILLTLAAVWDGSAATMLALSVYAACVLATLGLSGAYNMIRTHRIRPILRRLDHASIYLKIAGTQTPFAVLAGGASSAWLLTGVWCAAATGALAKIARSEGWEGLSIALYLALGWAGVLLIPDMWADLSGVAFILMLAGGALYSVGVIFHLWDSLPYQNAIWHGFVLAATFVFYSAVMVQVVQAAPTG